MSQASKAKDQRLRLQPAEVAPTRNPWGIVGEVPWNIRDCSGPGPSYGGRVGPNKVDWEKSLAVVAVAVAICNTLGDVKAVELRRGPAWACAHTPTVASVLPAATMMAGSAKIPAPIIPLTGKSVVPQKPTVRGRACDSAMLYPLNVPTAPNRDLSDAQRTRSIKLARIIHEFAR